MRGTPELVDEVEAGRSFGRLFDRHHVAILRFAQRRLASGDDAAFDVVSETFMTAWRHRQRCPVRADEQLPWLYAIAGNAVRNQLRSRRREQRLAARTVTIRSGRFAGPDIAETVVQSNAFTAAFRSLSESDQEVLRLVAWDGLDSPTQVAAALQVSTTAAGVRIHRARRRLQRVLASTTPSARPKPPDPSPASSAPPDH